MKFVVRSNVARSQILMVVRDFWTTADLADFQNKVGAAHKALARAGRPVTVLNDLRRFPNQSHAVMAGVDFAAHAASSSVRIERHAAVTSSVLLRMQLRRLFDGIPNEFFEDRHAAGQWLGWDPADPFLFEQPNGIV